MIDTHELAWAAGIFDGEGHIRYKRGARNSDPQRYTWKNIVFEVSQKDRRLLDRFQKIFGCGKVYGPYRSYINTRSEPCFAYRFVSSSYYDIKTIIELMWPWMGEVKREQASTALQGWVNEIRIRPGRKPKHLIESVA